MRRNKLVAVWIGALLAVTLTAAKPAAAAPDYIADMGWGMAAIGSNLFYMPAKMLYAVGGGIVGGLGYCLTGGSLDVAQSIWSPSLGGTWILSPEMMRGKNPILFSGESYEVGGAASVGGAG